MISPEERVTGNRATHISGYADLQNFGILPVWTSQDAGSKNWLEGDDIAKSRSLQASVAAE